MCQINGFTFLHGDGTLQLNYTGTVLFQTGCTWSIMYRRDIIADYCEKKISLFKNHTETFSFITITHITPIFT